MVDMTNGSVRSLKFYCPTHQIRFQAPGQTVIPCEQGGHPVGSGFPKESWWEFCCDCGTFWPADLANGNLQRTECRVCERSIARRYLCTSCQVVSLESSALVRRKTYSIDSESGIQPKCPGCDTTSNGQLQEHECAEANVRLLTSRSSCPFCERSLGRQVSAKVEQPAPAAFRHCPFCGTQQKAGHRFCKSCGKAQPEADQLTKDRDEAPRREAEETTAQKTAQARRRATAEALRVAEKNRHQEVKRLSEERATQAARKTKAQQTSTIAAALEAGKKAYQEEKQRVEEAGRQNEERQRLALELQRRAEEEAARRAAEDEARQAAEAEADRLRKEEAARAEAHEERLRVQEAQRQQEEHLLLTEKLHLRATEEEARRKAESDGAPAEQQLVAILDSEVEPIPETETSLPVAAADNEVAQIGQPETASSVPTDHRGAGPEYQTLESSQSSSGTAAFAESRLIEKEVSFREDSMALDSAPDTAEVTKVLEYVPSWGQAYSVSTPHPRRVPWMWISVLLVVAVIGITVAAISLTRRASSGDAQNNNQPSHTLTKASGPPGMVLISGGEFLMGSDNPDGDIYEKPAHKATVASFYIDTNEVTCEEYLKFVKGTSHRVPPDWVGGQYPDGTGRKPVTGVDWDDASAYAKWAGKRLPTEEEWEFAARGTTGWRYPWGDEWRTDAANAGNAKAGHFASVGSYPAGKSPLGMMDMIGNAWEWTATEWRGYPGGAIPPDASIESRVIRGGYWGSSAPRATTTFRRGWPSRAGRDGYKNTGFRCAADVNAQAK